MKCRTCDKKANPLWKWHCDECQAFGAFFQYEMNHLWSTRDSEEQFMSKLATWKDSLSDEEKDFIPNTYWNQ